VHKEARTQNYDTGETYTMFTVRSFSVNYNKTRKSRLKYELIMLCIKLHQKSIKT